MLSALPFVVVAAIAAGDCTPAWDTVIGDPGMTGSYVADVDLYEGVLFATGQFPTAGGVAASLIAQRDGDGWAPVGTGLANQFSNTLEVFQGELYVGGYFDSAGGAPGSAKLARWDGASWTGVGAQLESFLSSVWDLQVFDDGSGEALYVAGNYVDIAGTGVNHIARFDGEMYTELDGTISGNVPLIVLDMEIFDDGGGPALYIGGRFTSVGGVPANRIAKWTGSGWEALGAGLTGGSIGAGVHAMAVFDDGSGPALYAAGHSFTTAGEVPALRIAKWDGTEWHAVGEGFDSTVQSLAVFDDGTGPALYIAGNFSNSGGTPIAHLAKWDGTTMTEVGTGADDNIFDLFVTAGDCGSESMIVGGSFTSLDGTTSNRIGQLDGCPGALGDLNGDGTVDGADLGLLLGSWGPCDDCPADLDCNGAVDGADLGLLLGAWG